MRVFSIAAAAGLMLLTVSTGLQAQRPDDEINPRSIALVTQGRAAQAAGNLDGAIDALESALAVDPRNRQAFIALAEIARARGLPGKAIRFYHEALVLEPNDLTALRGQGEAMVQKGAIEKAKENLAKIRAICTQGCPEATQLAAAIDKGPPATVATTGPAPVVPTPSATPARP